MIYKAKDNIKNALEIKKSFDKFIDLKDLDTKERIITDNLIWFIALIFEIKTIPVDKYKQHFEAAGYKIKCSFVDIDDPNRDKWTP